MMKQAPDGLICPLCRESLTVGESKQLVCPNRHAFDIARQGYVNLILPGQQNTAVTGDDREMIAARTRFLESGAYQPLAEQLAALLCADATAKQAHSDTFCDATAKRAQTDTFSDVAGKPENAYIFCDAGCGEGYYTNRAASVLQNAGIRVSGFGFDLSRDGARHASSAAKTALLPVWYGVASLFHMPLADASVSAVVNCFAPCAEEEFHRILKPDGLLLMTVPGKKHLWGLKQCLYDTPYENEERRDALAGFSAPEVVTVRYERDVSAVREELFRMTPYFWKTARADHEKLTNAKRLTTEIEFDILCYRKK